MRKLLSAFIVLILFMTEALRAIIAVPSEG